MKTIGFIERHERKILSNSITYDNVDSEEMIIDGTNLENISKYLDNGHLIFSMTLALQDEKEKIIGPYIIYTDGYWIWPSYYSYYIGSKNIHATGVDFFNYMKSNNFVVPEISPERRVHVTKYFMELLLKNNPIKGTVSGGNH